MKQRSGFSLIELLLGLSIFSILIIVVGKLYSSFTAKQAIVKEHRMLLPYLDEFEHFLSQLMEDERSGTWFCSQDKDTKERVFRKECPTKFWRYKAQVTQKEKDIYEVNFFGKTRHLYRICYCLDDL